MGTFYADSCSCSCQVYHCDSFLPTPSLLVVLVGAILVNVSSPWTIILLQMVGNVIGFCLYGALTVQLCASLMMYGINLG